MPSRPEPEPADAAVGPRRDAALEAARDEVARLRGELVRAAAERERLRVALADARGLEAAGRLAAGIAHDFNNIITVISGHSRLLLGRIPPGDPLRGSVEGIQLTVDWGARLTRELQTACRPGHAPPAIVDVNEVVVGAGPMLRLLIGEDTRLSTRLDAAPCPVRITVGRLEQVITGLVAAVAEAPLAGDEITIATAHVDVDDARAAALGLPGSGRYVDLSIGDAGGGAEPTVRRAPGRHDTAPDAPREPGARAAGLATVRNVIAGTGGAVTGGPGAGAAFEVFLPLHGAPIAGAAASEDRPEMLEGTETVLVIEDERPVRELIRDVLRLHGYTVLDASDGAEAVEAARRHAGPIHLVILDAVTPGASATAIAAELRADRPHLRELLVSGHPDEVLRERGVVTADRDFLPKPFTVDALARKVREILDRP